MSDADFQLHGIRDPRLAVHAPSSMPAWLWSIDGTRILWTNAVAARLFGARSAAALADKIIGPADPHRRQVAQLSARLSPAGGTRLERLRGFGAPLGRLLTCACTRLSFPDGTSGILIAAAESAGRPMPLNERLAHLVDGVAMPAMTFTTGGALAGANESASNYAPLFNDLTASDFDAARSGALRDGQSMLQFDFGRVAVHRVGTGAETALVALIDAVIVPRPAAALSPPIVVPGAETVPAVAPVVADVLHHEVVEAATPPADTTEPETDTRASGAPSPVEHLPVEQAHSIEPAPIAFPDPVADNLHDDIAPEYFSEVTPSDVFVSAFDEPAPETESSTAPAAAADNAVTTDAVAIEEAPEDDVIPERDIAPDDNIAAPVSEPLYTAADTQLETDPAHEAPHHEPITPANEQHVSMPPVIDVNQLSATLSAMDGPPLSARRHPLRFMWQMDDEGRFVLGSDEFTRLIGSRTAAAFGRLWSEVAAALRLDPEGRVTAAVATRDTWSGIVVEWPADGAGARLPVELSGLPIYDQTKTFRGYRGFGVCRDLEGLARLAAQRGADVFYSSVPPSPASVELPAQQPELDEPSPVVLSKPDTSVRATQDNSSNTEARPVVDTPQNVVPFPSPAEPKSPALTAGESSAFDELARRLSARLEGEGESGTLPADTVMADDLFADAEAPPAETLPESTRDRPPAFLQPEAPLPRAASAQDSQLLDRLPVGVLVYRLDRLIYANRAFLASTGYDSLHALTEAGGLDALFVEAGVSAASSTSETGTPVVIAATSEHGPDKGQPADARLFAIAWDGEPAHALVFSGPRAETVAAAAPVSAAPNDDTTQAEELSTILDTTAEGIVIFDGIGRLLSCNRSAEALFGRDDSELATLNLTDLFAPESQRAVLDYLESVKGTSVASLLDHGRDMLGRVRDGGIIPLAMTMGRTRPDSARFFAIFRDLSQAKKNESELTQARRQAERSMTSKADVLGRISHEVRMPLNAIIGFADVMIEERFGALGNDRYVEYMKDIRASGQRVMAIIDDLLDLSRIESGKMELAFANQDLNSLVEQCVAVMQPQANRERIIIRTSLAHALPTVKADARALRQIALNLIGNSIHLANAGGQVIVSTATTDFGDIVLRVRDTGHGLNDNEIAAALEPFRTQAALDQTTDTAAVSLSLTKALVEANRATFNIKTAPHSGTLIEVVFSHASAIA
ncbi:MAG: PAS domain S-box protein [Pseudomonadota bacterium]